MEDAAIWLDEKKTGKRSQNSGREVSNAEALKLILKKMNYRQHVLKSKGYRGLFAKTTHGKALTCIEL